MRDRQATTTARTYAICFTELLSQPLQRSCMLLWIQYEPSVPPDVSEYIVDEYVAMRKQSLEEPDRFVSARTLLAILRLSQALARLRCSHEINRDDIIEARRLMEVSRSSITNALEDQQSRCEFLPVSCALLVRSEWSRLHAIFKLHAIFSEL